jgi:hypothetical protein
MQADVTSATLQSTRCLRRSMKDALFSGAVEHEVEVIESFVAKNAK